MRLEDKVIVTDLDGTLANIEHRLHWIQTRSRDYRAFHNAAPADRPMEWCTRLLESLYKMGHEIHVVSARPLRMTAITAQWLNTFLGCPYQLHLLRGDGQDDRPDRELKVDWAERFGPERILFWVDDRQRVVDAVRGLGITVLQCRAWHEWKHRHERVGGSL